MQCNKPKQITLSRPSPKKRSIAYKFHQHQHIYVKIAPTDYGEPSMPSKRTSTTKLSQLSPKISTSSSTRLYRGRAARLMSDNFYMLPHETERVDHDLCLSQSHYTEIDPTSIGSGRPQRGSNRGPPHQESRALLARAGQLI